MNESFVPPADAIGRFAIVKLWPDIKTAEDECIARLKIAAHSLGLDCVEIHADGRFLSDPNVKVSKSNVDFVIHLHFDTPKQYDAFSIVALWNPLKFYHEWGYARTSRNLTSHDDFISCSSKTADDHVARMVRSVTTHLPAKFHLYHSVSDIVHLPSLAEGKLFYAGINWEAISGGKLRHQEVLKRLDKTNLLRIYGPKLFQGVKVWDGYDSYVKEVPFDGISMIHEISKAGISLVLSSPAHKESELMSNRLFESIAAGALVICDENPFAKKFFGDCLLYIDSRCTVEEITSDIMSHIKWAQTYPAEALAMITKSQEIFRRQFSLTRNLSDLYCGLAQRKQQLLHRQNPPSEPMVNVRLFLLMPQFSEKILQSHLESVRIQDYASFSAALVVDVQTANIFRAEIEAVLATSSVFIELIEVEFFKQGIHPDIKSQARLGEIIHKLLKLSKDVDAFVVVAPNESLFSNHLAVLCGALQRDPQIHCAATAALVFNGSSIVHSVSELIDFGHVDRSAPPGYGRFIFRISAIPHDIGIALPYLDGRPLAVLVGNGIISQQLPASITIDVQEEFPKRTWDEAAENHVIHDYSPGAFRLAKGFAFHSPIHFSGEVTASSRKNELVRKFLNYRWIMAQIEAVRKQGIRARVKVLRSKSGF